MFLTPLRLFLFLDIHTNFYFYEEVSSYTPGNPGCDNRYGFPSVLSDSQEPQTFDHFWDYMNVSGETVVMSTTFVFETFSMKCLTVEIVSQSVGYLVRPLRQGIAALCRRVNLRFYTYIRKLLDPLLPFQEWDFQNSYRLDRIDFAKKCYHLH